MTARRFTGTRTVRLGDVGLDGTLRLDALARFLQDIAADDAADVGLRAATWVVRRTSLSIEGRPRFGERIGLTTFCGGLGSRWAERRTVVDGPSSRIEAASVWVYIDEGTGRPAPLPPRFLEAYTESAAGRTVSSRLTMAGPPEGAARVPWPLRPTDFDVLGHVNNAVSWAVLEDEPLHDGTAELEYRQPIEPSSSPSLALVSSEHGRWLVSDDGVHVAARLIPRPSS